MPVDLNKMKAKEDELNRAGRQFWTPKDGKSRIRIAPPPEGFDEFYAEGGFHYRVGGDEKAFPCPKLGQERETCFLCEQAVALTKSDDPEDIEEGEDLKAGRKYIIPILDLEHIDQGIQFWLCGFKAFKQIVSYFTDEQYGDITDPDEGYNVTVTKSGKGMKTDYEVRADKNPSVWPEECDDLLDELADPWTILTFASDGEMEAAYNGLSKTKGGSTEDAADPPRGRRERKSSGTTGRSRPTRGEAPEFDPDAAEPEDDAADDVVDEAAEEPEAEPAAAPSGRRARRGAAAAEPEPEAEPEPAPRQRSGGRSAAPAAAAPARRARSDGREAPTTRNARPESASRRLGRALNR